MDYCQLSILLNTTVMNILKHKAFFTICVCVYVLSRERKLGNCVIVFEATITLIPKPNKDTQTERKLQANIMLPKWC